MALTADQGWWIRTGGSDSNAGGYDSTVASAGTNYANQNAAQVSVTDGVTNGTTTVTSATANFTSLMIGNIIRITSDGYYCITARASSTSITVDRNTANGGSGRTMKVGGAFASPQPLCTTSSAGAPAPTSPLAPGHVVTIQDSGSDSPSVATYTWNTDFTFPAGSFSSPTTGLIKWIPSAGKKYRIDCTGNFATVSGHIWQGLYLFSTGQGGDTVMLLTPTDGSAINSWLYDCVFDQNGFGMAGTNIVNLVGCGFINSGAGGLSREVSLAAYYGTAGEPAGTNTGRIYGCSFVGWKTLTGGAIIDHPNWLTIEHNLIANCFGHGISSGTASLNSSIIHNTIYNCSEDGIHLWHFPVESAYLIRNNLIVNCGGYGIKDDPVDDSHVPARYNLMPDYNVYYNNNAAGAQISGLTAGTHDVTLTGDPFANAAALNFKLNTTTGRGAACSNAAFPQSYIGTTT